MNIELRGFRKRFGAVHALREVSLTIASGAKVALIGPNGSGKTTLIRSLLGLLSHEGELLVDGVVAQPMALAPRLAYVPQIAPNIAAPCRDVIRTVTALRGHDADRVTEIARRLDLDVSAVAARPFRALSGGSKQKLLIALALAAAPDLLILDEPTANLDAEARGQFFALHRELAGHATLLLCSHRLEEIRSLVTDVVALADGALSYSGSAHEYLDRRVGALIELRVDHEVGWLRDHGFVRVENGWWSRAATREEKLHLVPAAVIALGSSLVDYVVRDVDLVELSSDTAARKARSTDA